MFFSGVCHGRRRMQTLPPDQKLPGEPPPLNITAFETPLMHTEFERLQNRLPMDTLSMKRYELPPPRAEN